MFSSTSYAVLILTPLPLLRKIQLLQAPISLPPSLLPFSLPLFLSQFSPTAGPPDGGIYVTVQGTNFGTTSSHIQLVQIGRAVCDVINESYIPAVRYFLSILLCHSDVMISKFSFTCVTGEVDGVEGSHPILILFSYLSQIIISTEMFEFVVSCNL